MSDFREADARLGAMHGYEPVVVWLRVRQVPVQREEPAGVVQVEMEEETNTPRWPTGEPMGPMDAAEVRAFQLGRQVGRREAQEGTDPR